MVVHRFCYRPVALLDRARSTYPARACAPPLLLRRASNHAGMSSGNHAPT